MITAAASPIRPTATPLDPTVSTAAPVGTYEVATSERAAETVAPFVGRDGVPDLFVREHRRQSVRAEEEHVADLELHLAQVRRNRRTAAERPQPAPLKRPRGEDSD